MISSLQVCSDDSVFLRDSQLSVQVDLGVDPRD